MTSGDEPVVLKRRVFDFRRKITTVRFFQQFRYIKVQIKEFQPGLFCLKISTTNEMSIANMLEEIQSVVWRKLTWNIEKKTDVLFAFAPL